MASSKWKSFGELNELLVQKDKVIFWGASNWVEQTLDQLLPKDHFIVDNSKLNQGADYMGIDVVAPSSILQEDKKRIFIIITTSNYMSVIDELTEMGFVMGEDYCCSPLLNERRNRDDLKNYTTNIILSSPVHYADEKAGGGLYRCALPSGDITKLVSGKGRGLTKAGDLYAWIDMLKGIVLLDNNWQEVDVIELDQNSEPHGICYCKNREALYVAQPGRDSVAVYDIKTKKKLTELFISNKWAGNKKDNHHVNDLYVHGDSLFVSLFSFSGNWANEAYDGGVIEIDLKTESIIGPVVSNLWMPHSVKRIEGKLFYLDSMRGALKTMNWSSLGVFPNFVRGLAKDNQYFVIGASEHRYPEKIKNDSMNISLNSGFYVFDPDSKMSNFFSVPQINSVHDLLIEQ